jgi:sugar lactone lactonase YvrE
MRNTALRLLGLILLALVHDVPVHAAAGDTLADGVLGQRRFGVAIPYFVDGTVLAAADIAVDRSTAQSPVYIASPGLNRVLGWSSLDRLKSGAAADLVLGQPSVYNGAFVAGYFSCPAAPSATTFCNPTHVAVDPAGNLYVADAGNFRVLEFDRPFATDRVADRVFGQRSFTSRKVPAEPDPDTLDIAVDGDGDLWTIDPAGSRQILEYDAPPTHDTRPDRAIAFASLDECAHDPSPALPCRPLQLAVSRQGDLLYVGDAGLQGARQAIVFRQPLSAARRTSFRLMLPNGFPPEVAFTAAGGLTYVAGTRVWRYAAPLGPDTRPGSVSPDLGVVLNGVPDLDSAGDLLVASILDDGDSFVYVIDARFQTPVQRVGRPLLTDQGLAMPDILAVDRSSSPNHLYAVDAYNRVLGWRDAEGFANGAPADLVLPGSGQTSADVPNPNCFTQDPGPGQFCPYSSYDRGGLAVDSRGNLWMADVAFNRVLEFDRPFENDGIADRVLGQGGSFHTQTCNLGGLSARSLCSPGALAFDRDDRLYVADLQNHRVLLFEHPLTDDTANEVFGQPGFTQGLCNQGQRNPGAATLCLGEVDGESNPHFYGASGLAVDAHGNLYVADTDNDRVVVYRDPLTTDAVADQVLGQPGFQQHLAGTGPRRFAPGNLAIAVGPADELYVADPGNDRVLEFLQPLRDTAADRVFGHDDFAAGGVPFNVPPPPATAANLLEPMGVAVDAAGNLYVADTGHDRVLRFDRP